MAERTIPEAAARLGVSVDTIKRRVRSGALPSRRDARGRVLVDLAEDVAGQGTADTVQGRAEELAALRERLAAIGAERDWLRERVERAEAEREQLRLLLGNAQQQLVRALPPAPQEPEPDPAPAPEPPPPTPGGPELSPPWRRVMNTWMWLGVIVCALIVAYLLMQAAYVLVDIALWLRWP